MLTGGMEDVYNPLLFGLNPSLSLSLPLSICKRTESSHPHTSSLLPHPGRRRRRSDLCHTQSYTSRLHNHLSSRETSLDALKLLGVSDFPRWSHLIVMRIKNYPPEWYFLFSVCVFWLSQGSAIHRLSEAMMTLVKSTVQVRNPSHSICGKKMWELNFHNMLIYILQYLLGEFYVYLFVVLCLFVFLS